MSKKSNTNEIDQAMFSGGTIYVAGVKTYIDNPKNYEVVGTPTGFWILNAMGWKVYFKCPTRAKAQEACNQLYGVGAYTVNSKV